MHQLGDRLAMPLRGGTALTCAVVILGAPAAADARAAPAIVSLSGSMSIEQTYCAPGAAPGACSIARQDVTFSAAPAPAQRATSGRGTFGRGIRVTVTGQGHCTAESPATTLVGPDGSMQLLGGAERVDSVRPSTTVVLVQSQARRMRIAWLEPLVPTSACRYLGEALAPIAVPAPAAGVPRSLASSWIGPKMLERQRFPAVISGTTSWAIRTAAGATLRGSSSWWLKVVFGGTRRQARGPQFVG